MTVRATLFPYLSIIWDKIYASLAQFMMMTTFHASFFHMQRDANSTSITDYFLMSMHFCAFVECVHFGMSSFLSVQSVCVENNVCMLFIVIDM
jgi:hypothetical protein